MLTGAQKIVNKFKRCEIFHIFFKTARIQSQNCGLKNWVLLFHSSRSVWCQKIGELQVMKQNKNHSAEPLSCFGRSLTRPLAHSIAGHWGIRCVGLPGVSPTYAGWTVSGCWSMRGSTIGRQPLIEAHPVANAESATRVDKFLLFIQFSK